MKVATLPTIGTLDTTLPSPGDATYQTESLALTLHQIVKNLSDASFQFEQVVVGDMTTLEGDLRGFGNTFDTWLANAATASTQGLPIPANPAVPALTSAIGLMLAGGEGAIVPILINLAIDLIIRYIERKLDPTTNLDEIPELLQELVDKFTTTEGIDLADVMEDAWIDRNASDERYALLWNLIRQAIRVVIHYRGDSDDIILDDIV